ncbi:MAG: hypothetical protein R2939_18420 [Kofleriaceae bacterium]
MGQDPSSEVTVETEPARLPALRPEVCAPRRAPPGGGLLALTSLATMLALSGTLLLMQAHRAEVLEKRARDAAFERARVRPMHHHWRAPVTERTAPSLTATPDCQGPVFRAIGDGRTEVVFEQCPARTAR